MLFSQIRNWGNDVGMYDVTYKENGNDIMSAVVINTKAYMENNLQRESFNILFKLFRVIVFVYKLVERSKFRNKNKNKKSRE